jgi:hypothetical protein
LTLHRRFNAPLPWLELIEQHTGAGAWFAQLSLRRVDLAQALRDEWGEKIADVVTTLIGQLPGSHRPHP